MSKPIEKIINGDLQVIISDNSSDDGKHWYSVNLERNYKDKSGKHMVTNILNHDDLIKASFLLQSAYNKIQDFQKS